MNRLSRVFIACMAAVFAILAVLVSCSDPLSADYALDGPRILAVRANPPDLVPNGSVKLDALIYAPNPDESVSYEWTWCASVDSNLTCNLTAADLVKQLDPDGGSGVRIDYALGTSPTAELHYPVDPSILQALCEANGQGGGQTNGAQDGGDEGGTDSATDAATDAGQDASDAGDAGAKLTCTGSSASLTILLKATVGSKVIRAAKTITIYATTPTSTNTNPTLTGIGFYDEAVSLPSDGGSRASDEELSSVIGKGQEPTVGVQRLDDGGIQLVLHVPSTATDIYSPGGGAGPGGTSVDTGVGVGGGGDSSNGSDGGRPSDSGGAISPEGGPSGGPQDGGGDVIQGPPSDGGPLGDGSPQSDAGSGADGGGVPTKPDAGQIEVDSGSNSEPTGGTSSAGLDGGGSVGSVQLYESLTAYWYVQAGLFDSASTRLAAGPTTGARDYSSLELNRWVPPGPGAYTVVVVLRDNRNGVGWYSLPVRVK